MQKIKQPDPHPVCPDCGSDNVVADAWALWNATTDQWNLHATYDEGCCLDCETVIENVWAVTSADGSGKKETT